MCRVKVRLQITGGIDCGADRTGSSIRLAGQLQTTGGRGFPGRVERNTRWDWIFGSFRTAASSRTQQESGNQRKTAASS